MYNNMNSNITIEYDKSIIVKIKEMIDEGLQKLKKFIKSKTNSKYDVYYELEDEFKNIANNLRNNEYFNNEFKYFLFIRDKILYIIFKNCEDNNFGYCDFALELFDFFIDVWDAKIRIFEENNTKYEFLQSDFKKRYHNYCRKYYQEIYEPSDDFSEEEMYAIHESLRG